ncbi:hypothetical protein PUMCH_001779 [Australozyma saopauloensis]|uniref:Uncharacterized protein n=1 Tax=Australozyma saopauloensis TaxID=291208 RepID=A0AAX4H7F6_9ASCO|nr:hypothetical protein PUMCH_001779 [[Candida] saopauloensis]
MVQRDTSIDKKPILSMALPSSGDSIKGQDAQLVLEAYKGYPSETTSQNDSKDQPNESTSAHEIRRSTVAEAPDSLAERTNQPLLSSDSPLNLSQTVDGDEVFGDTLILDSSPILEESLNQSQSEDIKIDARHTLIALPLQEIPAKDGQSLSNVVPQGTESPIDTQLMSGDQVAATGAETASPKVIRVSRFWRKSPSSISLQFDLPSAKDVLEQMLKAIVKFMILGGIFFSMLHPKTNSNIKHIVNILVDVDGLSLIIALSTIRDNPKNFISCTHFLDEIRHSKGTKWKFLEKVRKFEILINKEYSSRGLERRVSREDLMRILSTLGTLEGCLLVCALSSISRTPEQIALCEVFVEICSMASEHASNQAISARVQQTAYTPEKEVVAKVFGSQIGSSILNLLRTRYDHMDVLLLRMLLMDDKLEKKKDILERFLKDQKFSDNEFICGSDVPMTVEALVSDFGRGLIREICVPKNTDLENLKPRSLSQRFKAAEDVCPAAYDLFMRSLKNSQTSHQSVSPISRAGLNSRKQKITDLNHLMKDEILEQISQELTRIGKSILNTEDSAEYFENVSETLRNMSMEFDNGVDSFHLHLSNFMEQLSKAYKDQNIELPDRLDYAKIKESALQCVNSFEYHIAHLESLHPQIDGTWSSIKEILSSLKIFYSIVRGALENYLREGQESVRLMAGGILFVEQRRTMMGVYIK